MLLWEENDKEELEDVITEADRVNDAVFRAEWPITDLNVLTSIRFSSEFLSEPPIVASCLAEVDKWVIDEVASFKDLLKGAFCDCEDVTCSLCNSYNNMNLPKTLNLYLITSNIPNTFNCFHTDRLSFVLVVEVFSCSDSLDSGFCGSGTFLNLR